MFKENFIRLCNKKNIAPTAVCLKLGIAKSTFSTWTEDSIPRQATLMKIADYFGVSVPYLLGEEQETEPAVSSNAILLDTQNVRMIPLYSTVSAGFGAQAINYVEDYVPLYIESSHEARETICIKVQGDSMYPQIEDGDIIQVHKQDSVDSPSLAVVLIDGEDALVKKVVYGDTWIELHSVNPMYKTMRFNGSDVERVRVLGLVKKIIKNV